MTNLSPSPSNFSQPNHKTNKRISELTDKIICGDSLKTLKTFPSESIDCVVTSPPYWALRDYGVEGQIGLESSLDSYLERLILIFDEIKRVLKPTGTCWVNFGDTYAGKTKGGNKFNLNDDMFGRLSRRAKFERLKAELGIPVKSLCMAPSRFALKMIDRGWILRNEIIWHKTNAMPQSSKDRFSVDFEKVFFFVKERKYFFERQYEPLKAPERLKHRLLNPDAKHKQKDSYWFVRNLHNSEAVKQKMLKFGRLKRCVWSIGKSSFKGNHFAVFPEKLIEIPILAGSPKGGVVLDPFMGSGTTALVAKRLGRKYIGIDLNPAYVRLADSRIKDLDALDKDSAVQLNKQPK